jgi:hypothetical protein
LGIHARKPRSPNRATNSDGESSDVEITAGPVGHQQDMRSSPVRTNPVINEGPVVSIKVRWKPHPLDRLGQFHVWDFSIRLVCVFVIYYNVGWDERAYLQNDTFRQIFDETADSTDTLVDDLVMSYKGRRIYSSISPASMNIWTAGELGKIRLTPSSCLIIRQKYRRV